MTSAGKALVGPPPALACSSFLTTPYDDSLPPALRALAYMYGMLYCFLGLGLIAQKYMDAMDNIVSQRRTVTYRDEQGITVTREERTWNPTVADITLLALGTSAPPISLSIISAIRQLGQPSSGADMGIGTMLGGAAFNFFGILACCILVPRNGTIKRVFDFGVFLVELIWSLWAYVWLFLVLQVWTPGEVTLLESLLTVAHMPLLMLHAYAQDQRWPFIALAVPGSCPTGGLHANPSEAEMAFLGENQGAPLLQDASAASNDFLWFPDQRPPGKQRGVAGYEGLPVVEDASADGGIVGEPVDGRQGQVLCQTATVIEEPESPSRSTPVAVASGSESSSADESQPHEAADLQRVLLNVGRAIQGGAGQGDAASKGKGYWTFWARSKANENEPVPLGDTELEERWHGVGPGGEVGSYALPRNVEDGSTAARVLTCTATASPSNPSDLRSPDLAVSRPPFEPAVLGQSLEHMVTWQLEQAGYSESVCLSPSLTGMRRRTLLESAVSHHNTTSISSRTCSSALSSPASKDPALFGLGPGSLHGQGESLHPAALEVEPQTGSASTPALPWRGFVQVIRSMSLPSRLPRFLRLLLPPGAQREKTEESSGCTGNAVAGVLCTVCPQAPDSRASFIPLPSPSASPYTAWGEQILDALPGMAHTRLTAHSSDPNKMSLDKGSPQDKDLMAALDIPLSPRKVPGGSQRGTVQQMWGLLCFSWRLLFAVVVPPSSMYLGWPAFLASILVISAISTVVIELTNLFACVTGLSQFVLALTLLACGTSIPNVIASAIAAQTSPHADSAIANVNASNSINVYLGLGLPWLITAAYNATVLHQPYRMDASTLGPSLLIYFGVMVLGLLILFARRRFVGGELGGRKGTSITSSVSLLILWVAYCTLSILQYVKKA